MGEPRIGVVGAGNVARYHLDVLIALSSCKLIGATSRSISSASVLADCYGITEVYSSTRDLVTKGKPDALMVLVSPDNMFDVVRSLLDYRIPLFVEKPPALRFSEVEFLAEKASRLKVPTMVGLNRRYYSVFRRANENLGTSQIIHGIAIEGHERYWTLQNIPRNVRKHWLFANSVHHIDLLRFFGGEIRDFKCFASATHGSQSDQFVASGIARSGALLNYISHWHSPGGWSVTLFCDQKTIKFSPLEQGVISDIHGRSELIQPHKCDVDFKPGFFQQGRAFIDLVNTGILTTPGQSLVDSLETFRLVDQFSSALTTDN